MRYISRRLYLPQGLNMKVKCTDAAGVSHFGMVSDTTYDVLRESTSFYYFDCSGDVGIAKSRFLILEEEPLPTFILGFTRWLTKPLTKECPCGIFRGDCIYHGG